MRALTQSLYSVLSFDLSSETQSDQLFPTVSRIYAAIAVFLISTFVSGMRTEFFNLLTSFYCGVSLDRRPPWERREAGRPARRDQSFPFRYL
ncbi:MAG: hypothetical protein ACREQP_15985 [Candidatus Binatia bacterium]